MMNKKIIFLLFVKFCALSVSGTECNRTPVTTNFQKFQNNVLKRRTRSVVFPDKASLLLTPAFSKAVLDGRPRGLLYSVEFDMYHPLPDTIEGWQPTILVNKLKDQKPSTISTNETVPNMDHLAKNMVEYNFHYLPEDYYEFPFDEVENSNSWYYLQPEWNDGESIHDSVRKFDNVHLKKTNKEFDNTNLFHQKPYFVGKASQSNTKMSNSNNQYKLGQNRNWHYYQDHSVRERRQLLEHLETVGTIFRFNMKACIRRAMCEIINNLKPYGESLIEDVIRLILTIPSSIANRSERKDVYGNRYDNINCEHYFALSCPYRVLDFLTKNIKKNIKSA